LQRLLAQRVFDQRGKAACVRPEEHRVGALGGIGAVREQHAAQAGKAHLAAKQPGLRLQQVARLHGLEGIGRQQRGIEWPAPAEHVAQGARLAGTEPGVDARLRGRRDGGEFIVRVAQPGAEMDEGRM
jgi:hypothetical protein